MRLCRLSRWSTRLKEQARARDDDVVAWVRRGRGAVRIGYFEAAVVGVLAG